jgi:hypothetical protein
VAPRPFARSARLERDVDHSQLDAFLVGDRTAALLERLARAFSVRAGVALAVAGPYGVGKSSAAVFVDALLGPLTAPRTQSAGARLSSDNAALGRLVTGAMDAIDVPARGFIRCVATAEREPIASTVVRALVAGVERFFAGARGRQGAQAKEWLARLRMLQQHAAEGAPGTVEELLAAIQALQAIAPLLIVVDEFGKSLEAAAASPALADTFVLQGLAEMAAAPSDHPIVLLALQHLSFQDHLGAISETQQREWAKIQGRFEEVPFSSGSREMIARCAAALEQARDGALGLEGRITRWAEQQAAAYASLNLKPALSVAEVRAAFPLQPVALVALPELCLRFGQNERTMFSFLLGPEPKALPALMANATIPRKGGLPSIGLSELFDYFVEAAGGQVHASRESSTWFEVQNRVLAASGLSADCLSILKAVAILNLVATRGGVRASAEVVAVSLAGIPISRVDVDEALDGLAQEQVVVFREFADEWRVWRGTDFDLVGVLDTARQELAAQSLAGLLESAAPLRPLVAGAHSQRVGTLRIFERVWVDDDRIDRTRAEQLGVSDGLVLYRLDGVSEPIESAVPLLVVVPVLSPAGLRRAALEVTALQRALDVASRAQESDWVAVQEIRSRLRLAQVELSNALDECVGASTEAISCRDAARLDLTRGLSPALSALCDQAFAAGPRVANETINRHHLSSQGARARGLVLAAMLSGERSEGLGLSGFGAEVSIYRAVLSASGIHRQDASGGWTIGPPRRRSEWRPVWDALAGSLLDAGDSGISASALEADLVAPPFGLRGGVFPVLLLAALVVLRDEVGVMEDGTFQPRLTIDMIERMLKNPDRVTFRSYRVKKVEAEALQGLAESIGGGTSTDLGIRNASLIGIIGPVLGVVRGLPQYSLRTRRLNPTSRAVRDAVVAARDPKQLLLVDLPAALEFPLVSARSTGRAGRTADFGTALSAALRELEEAYPAVISESVALLAGLLQIGPAQLRPALSARATALRSKTIEPRMRALLLAAGDESFDDAAWVENLLMVVSGRPPRTWADDDRDTFAVRARELLGTLLRLEGLYFGESPSTFVDSSLVRLALTAADGTEHVRIVGVDARYAATVREVVDDLLRALKRRQQVPLGDAVLAELAGRLLGDARVSSVPRLIDHPVSESKEEGL